MNYLLNYYLNYYVHTTKLIYAMHIKIEYTFLSETQFFRRWLTTTKSVEHLLFFRNKKGPFIYLFIYFCFEEPKPLNLRYQKLNKTILQ